MRSSTSRSRCLSKFSLALDGICFTPLSALQQASGVFSSPSGVPTGSRQTCQEASSLRHSPSSAVGPEIPGYAATGCKFASHSHEASGPRDFTMAGRTERPASLGTKTPRCRRAHRRRRDRLSRAKPYPDRVNYSGSPQGRGHPLQRPAARAPVT